jgi:hypothetical protein
MRTLPGFRAYEYDFLASPGQRFDAERKAAETWRLGRSRANSRDDAQLLFDSEGTLKTDVVARLLRERNDRPVHLRE